MYLVDTTIRALLIAPAMATISPHLTVLALLPMIGLPVAMVVLGQRVHRRTEAIQAQFSELTSHAHENLSGVRVVRAYRQEDAEIDRFRGLSEDYLDRNLSLAKVQGLFFPLLTLLGGMSALTVLYAGGRAGHGGRRDGRPIRGLRHLSRHARLAHDRARLGREPGAAGRRVHGPHQPALPRAAGDHRPPRDPLSLPLPHGGRVVEFRGVWFAYPGARDRGWVLQDISFRIEAGRSLAIVGATGAGKSALVDLLVRAYDPDKGTILFDGRDISRLSLAELRRTVGFVPQETFLFSETLRDNVLLGAPDDGTAGACRGGVPARGGDPRPSRRLRHHAGRARHQPLGRPEAARGDRAGPGAGPSDLRARRRAERGRRADRGKILHALRGALEGRTSIIVSHRLAAVREADWILVLDEGRIVEQGTHPQLIAAGGRYWELLRRQQLEEELEESYEN